MIRQPRLTLLQQTRIDMRKFEVTGGTAKEIVPAIAVKIKVGKSAWPRGVRLFGNWIRVR